MTRTTTWLSVLGCAVILAACSVGCGGSSPAKNTGKGGQGGHAGGGSAGSTGSGGAAAGDNGSAGAAAGDNGSAGAAAGNSGGGGSTAGSTGSAGGGTAGATAGANGGAGMDGGAADKPNDSGNTDSKADTAEVAQIACVAGGDCTGAAADFYCTMTRTCRRNQEQFCFCAPNNKIACEPCDTVDAGTDASSDAGADASTDAGDAGNAVPACPANVTNPNTTCDTNGERCAQSACNTTTHRQQQCQCVVFSATNSRWICGLPAMCQ